MQDEHLTVSLDLESPVPDMTGWTIAGLKRWYHRTRSMRNQEGVFKELLRRGYDHERVSEILTH